MRVDGYLCCPSGVQHSAYILHAQCVCAVGRAQQSWLIYQHMLACAAGSFFGCTVEDVLSGCLVIAQNKVQLAL